MSDIPSTWPENSAILQQIKAPSWYEKVLGKEYQIQSNQIKGVILNVKDKNITIINNPEKYSQLKETKQQTEDLNEDFKQKFINKLKKTSSREDILKSIEDWTIKIIEIPWDNNLYWLSIKSDLDYIYDLEWKMYVNMVRNLDDEYHKFYNLDLEQLWYSVYSKKWEIKFIDLKTKDEYWKENKKFFEIILNAEKFGRAINKILKDELIKRWIEI